MQWEFRGEVFGGVSGRQLSRRTRVHRGSGKVFQAVFSQQHSIQFAVSIKGSSGRQATKVIWSQAES